MQVAHRLSLLIIIGEKNPLIPYTMYTIYIEACTAGGCTPSPSIEKRTESRDPTGLQPPTVINITASSADVYWEAPTQPNGPIVAYVSYHVIKYFKVLMFITIISCQTKWTNSSVCII